MRPKKVLKLVHPYYARTVLTEEEAVRLRQQGWLELDQARSVSKGAAQQRRQRQHYREMGLKQLEVWLPPEAFEALESMRTPGETLSELVTKILCRHGE
jgi:hypothetical protein